MEVVNLKKIKSVLDIPVAIDLIEKGYVALSDGVATVPPVGYLGFTDPPADCHIKFGHIHGDEVFVIKIATGFYDNASRGLPIGNGMVVVLSAETGEPILLLHDSGYLTDVRTAIAGCIAARYLAPETCQLYRHSRRWHSGQECNWNIYDMQLTARRSKFGRGALSK